MMSLINKDSKNLLVPIQDYQIFVSPYIKHCTNTFIKENIQQIISENLKQRRSIICGHCCLNEELNDDKTNYGCKFCSDCLSIEISISPKLLSLLSIILARFIKEMNNYFISTNNIYINYTKIIELGNNNFSSLNYIIDIMNDKLQGNYIKIDEYKDDIISFIQKCKLKFHSNFTKNINEILGYWTNFLIQIVLILSSFNNKKKFVLDDGVFCLNLIRTKHIGSIQYDFISFVEYVSLRLKK
jgi:hypothetical protein